MTITSVINCTHSRGHRFALAFRNIRAYPPDGFAVRPRARVRVRDRVCAACEKLIPYMICIYTLLAIRAP